VIGAYLLLACGLFSVPVIAESPPAVAESPPDAAEAPDAVVQQVAALLDTAIEGRRDELRNNKEALYEVIDAILLPRFDRRYAAQLVLARHWRTASEEQRNQFTNVFYINMMQLYAEAVLEFNLARLEVFPFRGDASKKRVTVKTTMRLDDGTKVPVNYAMIKRKAGWQMFDVTIENISYVRNFKAELNSEIQIEGLDGVIARLEGKNKDSAAQ
jgi:phospholipid transport system substrate-binding protein